jgi:hypothetical protein
MERDRTVSKPKLHWITNTDLQTGEMKTACGRWLRNAKMQTALRREDVTCPRCMRPQDDPRMEDLAKEKRDEDCRDQAEESARTRGDES